LDAAIAHASSHGLLTRCVSNGYWAVTPEAARKRVADLRAVGLTELNFSTGDNHQEFVPLSRIVNATIAAAESDMDVAIAIESYRGAKFTWGKFLADERMAAFLKESPAAAKHVMLSRGPWIPFRVEEQLAPQTMIPTVESEPCGGKLPDIGCTSILTTVGITPFEHLTACCGLTADYIPEMDLGDLRERSMKDLYYSQMDDFLRYWIAVDGPQGIYRYALQKDPGIHHDDDFTHMCQICIFLYRDARVRRVLHDHFRERVADVMFRYELKRRIATKALEQCPPEKGRLMSFGV
jgi:hypothetical protein